MATGQARTAGRVEKRAGREGKRRPLARAMWAGSGLLIALILVVALLLPRSTPATVAACGGASGIQVGQCASNFTLSDLQGKRVSLADLRGKPLLLHFWAVGCTTCAAEYADFSRAVRASIPKGLTVLAVDAWGEAPSLVSAWQVSHNLPATFLVDPTIAVFQQYGGQGTPTTLFIDRAGRITARNAGPLSYDAYQRNIAHIL